MKVNYWECRHKNFKTFYAGDSENKEYWCEHPRSSNGLCDLHNKNPEQKEYCVLLDPNPPKHKPKY